MLHNPSESTFICDFEVYSDTVTEHFTYPQHTRPIENASGEGSARGGVLKDSMKISFRVDEDERIVAVYCRACGYAASVASGSLFSELILGLTVEEALDITPRELVEALSGLPARRRACAELPIRALEAAVADYRCRQASGSRTS